MKYEGHKSVARYSGGETDAWLPYTCAHCGRDTGGAVIGAAHDSHTKEIVRWLWCTTCAMPSVQMPNGTVIPGAVFGPILQGLPSDVEGAYDEARRCLSVQGFIACELLCRRILMHVAVEKGANEGESFASYVNHLEQQGYTTPAMKDWVDLIRRLGNKSTHRLTSPDEQRAQNMIMFTAQLLRTVYEMPFLGEKHSLDPQHA